MENLDVNSPGGFGMDDTKGRPRSADNHLVGVVINTAQECVHERNELMSQ